MNLQPLYDLKERLEHAAIAGTALIHEDFRLRRAVEALSPLAAASPVFMKIHTAAAGLLDAPTGGKLLDVLSLVNAVAYTQGAVGLAGELQPMAVGSGTYVHAPYSELKPLIAALSGTGSGRMHLIEERWRDNYRQFSDFRVLPYVVRALGDNYGELSDLIFTILKNQGESIIPMLKAGFDPAGKREMARRVQLITSLAGEKENRWYISVLPDAKKEVREAVVVALGSSQSNARLLLDLCRSERGKAREAALRALARMDAAECAAFWQQELKKKPQLIACLEGVNSIPAADLAAAALGTLLEEMLKEGNTYDSNGQEALARCIAAACGKYSPRVHSLWLWVAENMARLDAVKPNKFVSFCELSLAEHMQKCMLHTVLWNPCPQVLDLARQLSEKCRDWFLCCGFLADLIALPPQEVYERYCGCIVSTSLLKWESAAKKNQRVQLMRVYASLRWDARGGGYCLHYGYPDGATGVSGNVLRPVSGLDPRWLALLSDHGIVQEASVYGLHSNLHLRKNPIQKDEILMGLIDPADSESCAAVGDYLYKRLMMTGRLSYYMDALLRCGWRGWQGVPVRCAKIESQVHYQQTLYVLDKLPLSNAEKARELEELDALVARGQISAYNRIWPSGTVQMLAAKLKADPDMKLYY